MDRPTVTLCMIVKDETHIIEQCLRSMAKYVDRYDITDTGSTDGTQDLIKKVMDEYDGFIPSVDISDLEIKGRSTFKTKKSNRNVQENSDNLAEMIKK